MYSVTKKIKSNVLNSRKLITQAPQLDQLNKYLSLQSREYGT